MDLTGEDEIIEIPKNSHIDNSKARHKIVDGSTSSSIDIIDSRAHPKVVGRSKDSHDTVNSKNHLKIDDHSTKRRVDAVATNKLLHGPSRVADEPNHKRVKLIVGHRESESDDELPFSAKSEVKGALSGRAILDSLNFFCRCPNFCPTFSLFICILIFVFFSHFCVECLYFLFFLPFLTY